MQTDILSSDLLTASGLVKTCQPDATNTKQNIGRVRIKAVYYSASTTGTLTFRETSATGITRLTFAITAAASGLVLIPGEGILFTDTPYMVLAGGGVLTGATVFYG
jgi:hypothetical protein